MKLVKVDKELKRSIIEEYSGKVVEVSIERDTVECKSKDFFMKVRTGDKKDLKNVFEILSNKFEIAIIDVFEDDGFEKKALDEIEIFEITSIEELKDVRDFESLRKLIEKVKSENSDLCGAIGVFIGFVRKISDGKEVVKLEYEAYDGVFDSKLKEIEGRLKANPGVEGVKIYHKTGTLYPGEDIVYVVVMGRHRKDIWKPLAESMEIIKQELPIWKKEVYSDGEVWVHDIER